MTTNYSKLKISELKVILTKRKISFAGVFEKEELVSLAIASNDVPDEPDPSDEPAAPPPPSAPHNTAATDPEQTFSQTAPVTEERDDHEPDRPRARSPSREPSPAPRAEPPQEERKPEERRTPSPPPPAPANADEARRMKVSELKRYLTSRGVRFGNVFEKEDLIALVLRILPRSTPPRDATPEHRAPTPPRQRAPGFEPPPDMVFDFGIPPDVPPASPPSSPSSPPSPPSSPPAPTAGSDRGRGRGRGDGGRGRGRGRGRGGGGGSPPPYERHSSSASDDDSDGGGGRGGRGGRGGAAGGKRKAEQQENTTVYVSGLPKDVTENEIEEHFSQCGAIKRKQMTGWVGIKIYRDFDFFCKGDALVTFKSARAAAQAVEELNGDELRGDKYPLRVEFASFNSNKKPKQ